MHSLSWLDLRYSARFLLKNSGYGSLAAITLALGICASTAIFSMVNEFKQFRCPPSLTSLFQKPLFKSAMMPRLENNILGEGAPTVVFSPGFSGQMKTWFGIQPVVAKYTKTF